MKDTSTSPIVKDSILNARTRLSVAAAATLLLATIVTPASATPIDLPGKSFTATYGLESESESGSLTADPNVKISFATPHVDSKPSKDTRLKVALQSGSIQRIGGLLDHPLPQSVLTSPYAHRISPITGQPDEFHTGQDYGAACGSNVSVAAAGTVTFVGWHAPGGGNRVEVDHGNGLTSNYNHLQIYHVSVGQKLVRGQSIALVGTTGSSTGCHLHFEVWRYGAFTDPLFWL